MLRQLVDCHELLASASVDGAGVERPLGSHGLNDTSHLRVTEGAAFTDFVKIVVRGITPYGNGLDHVNSLLQTATVTDAPVVGVAVTAETAVPGSATGASREVDLESAARFCIDVAKLFTTGHSHRHDPAQLDRLTSLYGSMKARQTPARRTHELNWRRAVRRVRRRVGLRASVRRRSRPYNPSRQR